MSFSRELNLDSLVGPTHNYAGLSFGNVASGKSALSQSNPKQAALEGLAKMKFLHDLGVPQAVLPPQARPDLAALRRLGFAGTDEQIIEKAWRYDPRLVAAVYSASAMWAANAATVSPSADCADGRVHLTPANLITQFHRSLEPEATADYLKLIFPDASVFVHNEALPSATALADEGAANHLRLCGDYAAPGVEVFVYGRQGDQTSSRFPARQTRAACEAIARLHQLAPDRTVFAQQNPRAIDAGVFHNDVIAMSNQNVLICHADAWCDGEKAIEEICRKFAAALTHENFGEHSPSPGTPGEGGGGGRAKSETRNPKSEKAPTLTLPRSTRGGENSGDRQLWIFSADENELSLADAVSSYIFNSQLVTLPDGTMTLIAPVECRENPRVRNFISRILTAGSPVKSAHYLDVRQSMKNGGGPACLRLRVALNDVQLSAVSDAAMLTPARYDRLVGWVEKCYRDCLSLDDLRDPSFMREVGDAMTALHQLTTSAAQSGK